MKAVKASQVEEYEYDSEIEQQTYLSKLENITNYLKQISLHISATMKEPSLREYARNVLENFDKTMDEYNNQYVRTRMNRLISFKIQLLALNKEDNLFIQTVQLRERTPGEQGYFANMVFVKSEKEKFYRMHVELWKYDGQINTTNCVLSRYEKNCMNYLVEVLTDKGFISYIEGTTVALKTKRTAHRGFTKGGDPSNVFDFLKFYVEGFLKDLNEILTKEEACYYCGRHYMFQSRFNVIMPPTVQLFFSREKTRDQSKDFRDEKPRMFHEGCAIRFLKGPPIPIEFKPLQRERRGGREQV